MRRKCKVLIVCVLLLLCGCSENGAAPNTVAWVQTSPSPNRNPSRNPNPKLRASKTDDYDKEAADRLQPLLFFWDF